MRIYKNSYPRGQTLLKRQLTFSATMSREEGTVKWFNDDKGYGFITRDSGGPDVFVHHSEIRGCSGRRTLYEDDRVSYVVTPGRKGEQASDVEVMR